MKSLIKKKGLFPDFRWIDDFWEDEGGKFDRWSREWTMPAVNVTESAEQYVLEFGVPGMSREDFKLTLENGKLMVTGEKEVSSKEEKDEFMRREFNFTSFSRTFWLPENVVVDDIRAAYDNGILRVTLPKKEAVAPEKHQVIEVN